MANYTVGNVYVITSSAAQAPVNLPHVKRISAIKYFSGISSTAAASSTAAILSKGFTSTGASLWYDNRAGGPFLDLLAIYDGDGVTVSVSGGVSLYLYSSDDVR